MSNQGLIIQERSRDIGDFIVGRLIPFRKKRMVGPFVFIDHMSPITIKKENYIDVGQHPHIGIATLTYMLEGDLMHKDSTGTTQRITPGSVNWMIAGKGVTHTERTPEDLRNNEEFTIHGYQIWVALPKEFEEIEPEFHHFMSNELPNWEDKGASYRLIAGKGYGRIAPVPVYSDLFMIEVKNEKTHRLHIQGELQGEIGVCIVRGAIEACGNRIAHGNMLVSKTENNCTIVLQPKTHILLFGGKQFKEEYHIYWNFVSSDLEKIEAAKKRWKEDKFPKVPNDHTYIPLPE